MSVYLIDLSGVFPLLLVSVIFSVEDYVAVIPHRGGKPPFLSKLVRAHVGRLMF